jgi:hypothetical protein
MSNGLAQAIYKLYIVYVLAHRLISTQTLPKNFKRFVTGEGLADSSENTLLTAKIVTNSGNNSLALYKK